MADEIPGHTQSHEHQNAKNIELRQDIFARANQNYGSKQHVNDAVAERNIKIKHQVPPGGFVFNKLNADSSLREKKRASFTTLDERCNSPFCVCTCLSGSACNKAQNHSVLYERSHREVGDDIGCDEVCLKQKREGMRHHEVYT
jgi:hypothetical protein